jgi:hypothetical protein
MESTKRLRFPFVITCSVAVTACGTDLTVLDQTAATSAGAGGVTSASSGSTGGTTDVSASSSSASTGGSGGTGSSSSSGNNGPNCPPSAPGAYDECKLKAGEICSYEVGCQSGPRFISFTCWDGGFGWRTVAGQACTLPFDSCPGTDLYCGNEWGMPAGTNPPAPCPDPPPTAGSECFSGGFGGVHAKCGYPCEGDPNKGWQIASCTGGSTPNDKGSWSYDNGCG